MYHRVVHGLPPYIYLAYVCLKTLLFCIDKLKKMVYIGIVNNITEVFFMSRIRKAYLTPSEESFGLWNGSPSIFCKYDWFTCVFNDVSIGAALDCIHFYDYETEDYAAVFARRFLTSSGATPEICLNFNGVVITVRYDAALYFSGATSVEELEPEAFFNLKLPYVRMDISGSGLDYLRSIGNDIDPLISNPFELEEGSYHPTRLDVAFDLIDYCPEFLNQCKEACRRLAHPQTGRVPAQSNGGIKWSERGGDQNTLYLGSVGSDRLLRIYDKKLQFVGSGKYNSSCPYRNGEQLPNSWLRLELQVRRERESSYVLYDLNTFEMIFKYIYDKFAVRELEVDKSYRREPGEVTECWITLFDWKTVSRILQNKNFVQFRGVLERSEDYIFTQAITNVLLLMAHYGKDAFYKRCIDIFNTMQSSQLLSYQRRFNRLLTAMLSENYNLPPFVELTDQGVYRFKE